VAYGVGFLSFYYPILSMVNEFWITRRGMAYGLLCSSSGVSGAAVPFVIQLLLDRYGYRTTLRAIAVALLVVTGPLIPFLGGRLPHSAQAAVSRTDWAFLRNPLFWIYSVSNVAQGLGYFFPSLYLPSYVTSLGLNSSYGPLLLALMSVSQVLGQFTFGLLSDRNLSLGLLTSVSTVMAGVAALALWGLATSMPLLVVFALTYGFFAAGYTAMWARMSTAVTSDAMTMPVVFGLFNFGKGIGNVLAGPISSTLLFRGTFLEGYGAAKYMPVIVFTGCSMIFGTMTLGLRHLRLLKMP
jgi:predicted MFS family arabinose efflux permease